MGITKRTGDDGNTEILSGERVSKNCSVIEAIGAYEELICRLGLAKLYVNRFKATINRLQRSLIQLSKEISSKGAVKYKDIDKEVHFLDVLVEEYSRDLDGDVEMTDDIIPGVNLPSAELHVARVACRQLERKVVALRDQFDVDQKMFRYLNRLSDVIFLMAMIAENKEKIETDYNSYI